MIVGFTVASPARTSIIALPETGLIFPSNGAPGSDIRIVFDGANLLSRTAQTVIWEWNSLPGADGYRAQTWSSHNDGTFHFDSYEFGGHPFPCDGAFDGNGNATGGTGGTGAVRYMELAGVPGGQDGIAEPMTPAFLVDEANPSGGTIYRSARTVRISGANLIHRVYPDIINTPGDYIERTILTADLAAAGATPAFYFGASDWRANQPSAGRNDECPGYMMRFFRLFSAALDAAGPDDLVAEASVVNNATVTAAGAASIWYSNISPTPTDISDKSSAGHNPSWANANRPTLWTP
jgi:hypothetical protein